MAAPKDFMTLAAAYDTEEGIFVNIIGAVVDLRTPTLMHTGDYMFTFKLLDQSMHDFYGDEGLMVRFFKKQFQDLPRIGNHGDVVLLRNIKMTTNRGQKLALAHHTTCAIVFPAASIPDPSFEIAYQGTERLTCLGIPLHKQKVKLEEQSYVIQIKHEVSSVVESLPTYTPATENNVPPPTAVNAASQDAGAAISRKFKQIKYLRHYIFADLVGQVVKVFPNQFDACELYITDYTENEEMWFYTPPEMENQRERDGDDFGYSGVSKKTWPGPYGFLVLKINVKQPHAGFAAREIEKGDFVLLRNVKMKIRDSGKLEGDMWPDHRNPEKVQINKIKQHDTFFKPEIEAILERKAEYMDARRAIDLVEEPKKREKPEKPEKSRRQERKERKRKRETEQAAVNRDLPVQNGESDSGPRHTPPKGRNKLAVNKYTRCGHDLVPASTIKNVLANVYDPENKLHVDPTTTHDIPFQCAKYRALARVVDFAPSKLEDFAILKDPDEDRSDSPVAMDFDSSQKYEWSFSLQLEDASKPNSFDAYDRLWVDVCHEDAQYLFGNDIPDPTDLRRDTQLLHKVKNNKLDILWGNLREEKEKAEGGQISNTPFECCLMEYGIKMNDDDPDKASSLFGFKRGYRMFGVTIL